MSTLMRRRVGIRYGKPRMGKTFDKGSHFYGMKVYVPNSLYTMLQAFRAARGIPIARLIAIAVYNELKRDKPFDLKLKPTTDFIPGRYEKESGLIYKFLTANGGGMALDLLVLSRDMLGIPEEDHVLHGVRELLDLDIVEEISTTTFARCPWIQIKRFKQEGLR